MEYAEVSSYGDNYEFCMPEECNGMLDYVSSNGYGGDEDVVWTITNLVTGDEVFTADINE